MTKSIHWPLWSGLALSIAAFISYFTFFDQFPVTRDVPWVSAILFLAAIALLITGLRRGYAARRRVLPTIVAVAGIGVAAFFAFAVLVAARMIPSAPNAPKVGQKAPEFALADTNGRTVMLSQLLDSSPKGVLLIFYRGYW